MVYCINPGCRKQIEEQFYFCPYCGTDNRPPDDRFDPTDHLHQYPDKGNYYCVWCGVERGRDYFLPLWARKIVGPILLALCIGSALFSIYVAYSWYRGYEPNPSPFQAWCAQERLETSRRYMYKTQYKHANGKLLLLGAVLFSLATCGGAYVILKGKKQTYLGE